MKKLFALLPSGSDWLSTVEHALAFGLSAALAIRVVPALFRAIDAGTTQTRAAIGLRRPPSPAFLKVFGQRR
jgi:hypothetical protein